MEEKKAISVQAFRRMPLYLQYLRDLRGEGVKTVSAPNAAARLGFTEIQVRKDFAAVSQLRGRPKCGFEVQTLIISIEELLGCKNSSDAVLVGVGSLGRALLDYDGFKEYGLNIAAAFDSDKALHGQRLNGVYVLPPEKLSGLCRRLEIKMGIIAVPQAGAQIVCDQLIAGGVLALWNFAQVSLSVPEGILVQNENMAASLALLSRRLRDKLSAD